MIINPSITLEQVGPKLDRVFAAAGPKIVDLSRTWDPQRGTPVFTVDGRYTTRGWTEWTQGFQFGGALLQFDATGGEAFLRLGREGTLRRMATHVSHVGVHDHGFNNVSTYGNLRRLMLEGRMPWNDMELECYNLALKVSGAVQASRWTPLPDGQGFIPSFNGRHSLFADTIRSLRILGLAYKLGHTLMGEGDRPISLLERLIRHAQATALYNVYYGQGRDLYDVPGRVAHESVFNPADGSYRCPSTQQGYSVFSTWTRGLAWIILGYAEQLEFFETLKAEEMSPFADPVDFKAQALRAAAVASDFYLQNTCSDGIPFWDTGAPGLVRLPDYRDRPSDPFNAHEPVDSSAAAIAAQGFWRLGRYLAARGDPAGGRKYRQAALTLADTLCSAPYLSESPSHQGLLLHVIYHRPRGWDHVPPGSSIPRGESALWGDYHLLEFALLLRRELEKKPYLTFFPGC
ncbi:MAG: glycosyl hydrolase [Armatimonadetes bacterium]|nr:glycosyl hydrolase [Planctomycetota bacterium]MBI2201027.1 glycosyl hydrolase [Armatimonadota bacterium]